VDRKPLKQNPEARLLAGLVALRLDTALAAPLSRYLGELVLWNKAYNLTSVRDPAEMVTRHLLDSLTVLPHVAGRVIDIGTGAGLPGLPLAIANPALQVTLLDSNGKKTRFLRNVQRLMSLPNVEIVEARAEALKTAMPFDAVISRAYASISDFVETTADIAAADGRWLAMKGKLDAQEISGLPAGYVLEETVTLKVPALHEDRHLLKIRRA
jgi:16S rRNA (guanine527-N7)-methyltransferase